MTVALLVIFYLTLVLASAFFSASETALVSLSPQKAKTLALRSTRVTEALQGWLVRPQELLTLILIGNTFVNVLLGSLLTITFVHYFPSYSEVVIELMAWLIGTGAIVIVGEMMPKFIARAYPERTSLLVLPWLSAMRRAVAPALEALTRPLRFLFPQFSSTGGSIFTFSLEELKSLLEEDSRGETNSDESIQMVQRVLDIHDRRAEAIMTPLAKVDLIEVDPAGKPTRSPAFLIDLIVEEGHTRTPVKRGGKILGFIHCNDLLPFLLTGQEDHVLNLVRPAMPVPADRRVADLLNDFRQGGIHMGFVLNAEQAVVGIVTLEDVLEEITGEILDEYDVQPTPGSA